VTVYVDNMRAKYGRMVMCHMLADTTEELLAMAQRIGVSHWHLQHASTPREHFDICLAKRALAVKYGAKEIAWRDTPAIVRRKREQLAA
jgi:phosphoribosyl 1,2-cyclic phosphodiesterase